MNSLTNKIFTLIAPKQLILEEKNIDLNDILADQYLARTVYTAISVGTETAAYAGMEPLRTGKVYPRFLGYCNIAEIIKIGKNISQYSTNDFILTFQSHRSHFIQNQTDFALSIPEGMVLLKATTAYLFHLGLHSLQTGNARAGHNIGIIGMGTLGVTTAVMSQLSGARTFLFTNQRIPENLSKLHLYFFNKDENIKNDIEALTNNTGLDIIINTSNKWKDWKLSLLLIRKGGTIVNLGFPGRGEPLPDFNPLDPVYVYTKNITIKPLKYINESNSLPEEFRFNLKRNLEYILYNIKNEMIKPELIITEKVPFYLLQNQYEKYLKKEELMFTTVLDWQNTQ